MLDPSFDVVAYVKERSAIMPASEGGCWLWTLYCSKDGYPRFHRRGVSYYAHREMARAYGMAVDGMTVDHWYCHTPSCVNPAHLITCDATTNTRRARNQAWRQAMAEHFRGESA
jgi:hypothetical protein